MKYREHKIYRAVSRTSTRGMPARRADESVHMRNVGGHVEVYRNGEFLFSADTEQEALQDLQLLAA